MYAGFQKTEVKKDHIADLIADVLIMAGAGLFVWAAAELFILLHAAAGIANV